MEQLFQAALKEPSLKIFSANSWGASNPQHKELIYSALDQALQSLNGYFSSVSHTTTEGGFALSSCPIGFDIEITNRVTPEIVARISSPKELASAPDVASLWCAKEAAFKALKTFQQPKIVSQIEIQFDRNEYDRCTVFRVENEKDFGATGGLGAVYATSSLTYCVLIFRKDF